MNCDTCPFKSRNKVPSSGDPLKCKYILMGEAPGWNEVRLGRPFVGETGKLLEAFLTREGLELHGDDFYLMNAMSCPVRSKKQTPQAVAACRPRVLAEINAINPDAILVVMGKNARESLYPGEQGGILGSRGWRERNGRDVFVMAHPAYYLYNPDQAPMLVKDIMRIKRGRLPQIGPFRMASHKGDDGEYIYHLLDTHEKLDAFISDRYRTPKEDRGFIAYDLETDQVDFQRDRILCMSISLKEGEAHIIPDSLLYEDGFEFVTTSWSKKQWTAFTQDRRYKTGSYLRPNYKTVAQLRMLWAIPGFRWVGQNSKFDMRFLHHLGVKNVHTDFDTIIAHYTLDERRGGHALKPLADDYFDVGDYESDLFQYITKKSAHYSRIPRDVLYRYNAMDTECTLRLACVLEEELKTDGLYERPFMYPMMEALPMLLHAELTGVWVDWEEVDRIQHKELAPALEEIQNELREISGYPELNPLSSVKVNNILYDDLGLPIVKARTRAGGHKVTGRSSQRAIMDMWAQMWEQGKLRISPEAWRFVEKLREYRHLRKLLGSYIRKWQAFRGTDDRVHTSFLLRGTVTGRLSSRDPPMQTIPSKITDKWGPMVANIHKPEPGWVLLYADYSQAELMAIAVLSGDQFMIKTFRSGADYHDEVSQEAFGDSSKDHRVASKRLTFGWAYGGNVKEIAMQALQVDSAIAERFAREWDERFAGVVAWRKTQAEKMQRQGYVESILGRRRRQLLLTDKNIGKAKRIAVNAPVQSAVSDLNLLSAVRLYQRYENTDYARVILLIHDSLIMEVREDRADEVIDVMYTTMLEVPKEFFPEIQFKTEVKTGYRLGDLT